MPFSKTVILQLVILGVVFESDLGRKKIGWFRILRPVIAAVAIVPFFFKSFPTRGNDLVLEGLGALAGIVFGLLAVSPALVEVEYDPSCRGRVARWLKRPAGPAAVSISGVGYALIWIVVSAARLTFAYTSQHSFPHALGTFLANHHLDGAALTDALIFLPVGMDVFRSIGLLARGQSVLNRTRAVQPTAAAR